MHFAFPPRKPSAHSTMFTARASKAPLFRRSRIQFLVLCALGIGTLLFIIAKILGFGGGAPPGTPLVVIVTVINPESQSKQYIADIKENREQYAKKHGKTQTRGRYEDKRLTTSRICDFFPNRPRLPDWRFASILGETPRHAPRPHELPIHGVLLVS